jgi:hypothetical protein
MDYFRWIGIATSIVWDIISKTRDGDFTLAEALDVTETGLKRALPEIGIDDFNRFSAITSQAEFDAHDFHEGDVLLCIPSELVGQLKLEFNK